MNIYNSIKILNEIFYLTFIKFGVFLIYKKKNKSTLNLMSDKRKYVFWFHYNKPQTSIKGRPQVSIHYKKQCHIVDNIVVNVNTEGKIRDGEQPNFVIRGLCSEFKIIDNIAYIS